MTVPVSVVVRPGSTAEVAAIMEVCHETNTPVVPQGGNTGLVEGSVPDADGKQVILSLRRMQAVRAIDLANMTVTVEAGCVLQSLQEAVHEAGLLFPLSLGAEGSCTIGGNLATNAGGTQVPARFAWGTLTLASGVGTFGAGFPVAFALTVPYGANIERQAETDQPNRWAPTLVPWPAAGARSS